MLLGADLWMRIGVKLEEQLKMLNDLGSDDDDGISDAIGCA